MVFRLEAVAVATLAVAPAAQVRKPGCVVLGQVVAIKGRTQNGGGRAFFDADQLAFVVLEGVPVFVSRPATAGARDDRD